MSSQVYSSDIVASDTSGTSIGTWHGGASKSTAVYCSFLGIFRLVSFAFGRPFIGLSISFFSAQRIFVSGTPAVLPLHQGIAIE